MGFVSAWRSGVGMDPRGGRCAGAPVLRGAGPAAGRSSIPRRLGG